MPFEFTIRLFSLIPNTTTAYRPSINRSLLDSPIIITPRNEQQWNNYNLHKRRTTKIKLRTLKGYILRSEITWTQKTKLTEW